MHATETKQGKNTQVTGWMQRIEFRRIQTARMLLRWKVSDNEYRVIYGDLHVETITPEKLAELEAALPK